MKKVLVLMTLLLILPTSGYFRLWTLSDANLTVQFDDQTLLP